MASKRVVVEVYRSVSHNVHANLAFEDWLFEQCARQRKHVLYLWWNRPAVVVGKYQNHWLECNMPYLAAHAIGLARRRSGGGAVFHDMGNLNCTFITPSPTLKRGEALQHIVRGLRDDWGLPLEVNERHDLVLGGKKVSGSAYKVASQTSCHHCTLLVNASMEHLRHSLRSPLVSAITSRSVPSVRSSVTNLSAHSPVSVSSVSDSVARAYKQHFDDDGIPTVDVDTEAFAHTITADSFREHVSWQWQQCCPPYTVSLQHDLPVGHVALTIEVDGTIIKKAEILLRGSPLASLSSTLVGRHFVKAELLAVATEATTEEERAVVQWLADQL